VGDGVGSGMGMELGRFQRGKYRNRPSRRSWMLSGEKRSMVVLAIKPFGHPEASRKQGLTGHCRSSISPSMVTTLHNYHSSSAIISLGHLDCILTSLRARIRKEESIEIFAWHVWNETVDKSEVRKGVGDVDLGMNDFLELSGYSGSDCWVSMSDAGYSLWR
jgi:hypothetical protein